MDPPILHKREGLDFGEGFTYFMDGNVMKKSLWKCGF